MPNPARRSRTPSSRPTVGTSTRPWHLALTDGAADETKGRYAFVFGDFHRLHRMGLIACYYRAAEWEHTEVMLAAHKLLLYLDKAKA